MEPIQQKLKMFKSQNTGKGSVRVGRTNYGKNGKRTDPSYKDFTKIIVLMKSHSKWGMIGPYDLVDESGRIMENIWQFAKIYPKVPKSKQKCSRYNPTIVWEHPAETHIKNHDPTDNSGEITDEYRSWREKGMNNKYAVRYPVGFHHRHKCVYALAENAGESGSIDDTQLNYVESRKRIYLPVYCEMVKKHPLFRELQDRLEAGENLLIIEVDGPHQESLEYYKDKYGVADDFIENNTMLVNEHNIQIMLNDDKHPFGHGYCLAMALLDKDVSWNFAFFL
jgi:hypothetical protein